MLVFEVNLDIQPTLGHDPIGEDKCFPVPPESGRDVEILRDAELWRAALWSEDLAGK
jgi:hypothetical protein